MKKLPEITTERLLLRAAKTSDAEAIAEWISDRKLYEFWSAKPLPLELNPLDFFADENNLREIDTLDWFIYHKADKKVIGEVEFFDIEDDYQTELSYRISTKYQGSGYAAEAVKAAVKAVYKHTKINRIQTHIDVRNIKSENLIKKIGFRYEGTIRQLKFYDTISDFRLYSFLRTDND
ncbi:MAG: GNAT family N-acetyltransferase [Ruminococcus sp.]|nr:GNAT family N-acetyltransferase [Ruminococcus sp.]